MKNLFIRAKAFTLLELLVAMGVVVLMLAILLNITNGISKGVQTSRARSESFTTARNAFELITRQLSQATLNTYWDYKYDSNGLPQEYYRQSELRFVAGPSASLQLDTELESPITHATFFQAPLGNTDDSSMRPLNNLISTVGFYVDYRDDKDIVPPFINPGKQRYRLMQLREPSEALSIYKHTSGLDSSGQPKRDSYSGFDWFLEPLAQPQNSQQLAENVVALILLPRLSEKDDPTTIALAPDYLYDSSSEGQGSTGDPMLNSKNQIPPLVDVTIVSIDSASANRLQSQNQTLNVSNLFASAADYEEDLESLEDELILKNLTYRIFKTTVAIQSSKWSVE